MVQATSSSLGNAHLSLPQYIHSGIHRFRQVSHCPSLIVITFLYDLLSLYCIPMATVSHPTHPVADPISHMTPHAVWLLSQAVHLIFSHYTLTFD